MNRRSTPAPRHSSFRSGFWETIRAIIRDKGAILLLVAAPLLYGFFYPWPYSNAVARQVPVAIIDHDNSTLSRQIIRYATASPRLSVQVLSDEQAAQFALWRGEIDAYMIIPDSLKHDVVMRQPVTVSIEGNGSYPLLNKEALTGLSEVVGTVSAGIEIRQYRAAGMNKNQAKIAQNPVPLITQALYNPSQGYGSYIVPAVALLILQQTLLMGTALVVGTWVEQEKAHTTPAVWAGRVLALSCFGWLNGLLYFGWIFTLQGYTHGANWLGALLLLLIFAPVITSIGCVFGVWFKQRERAMQILLFSSLPMFFLSGFTWPVEALPRALQYARWLLPSTPAIEASIRFNQIGTSIADAQYLLAVLTLMGLFNFVLLCFIGRSQPSETSQSPAHTNA